MQCSAQEQRALNDRKRRFRYLAGAFPALPMVAIFLGKRPIVHKMTRGQRDAIHRVAGGRRLGFLARLRQPQDLAHLGRFLATPDFEGPMLCDSVHLPLLTDHDRTEGLRSSGFHHFVDDMGNGVNFREFLNHSPFEVAVGFDARRNLVARAMSEPDRALRRLAVPAKTARLLTTFHSPFDRRQRQHQVPHPEGGFGGLHPDTCVELTRIETGYRVMGDRLPP